MTPPAEAAWFNDSDIQIALATGAVHDALMGWRESAASSPAAIERARPRADEILGAVQALQGDPASVGQIRAAMAARESSAANALVALEAGLSQTANDLVVRLGPLHTAEDWLSLRREADIVAAAAGGAGEYEILPDALLFSGIASRELGDPAAAMATYQRALQASVDTQQTQLQSLVLNRMANLLEEADRLDEAIDAYTGALALEENSTGRVVIRQNRARALSALGEFRAAEKELESVTWYWQGFRGPRSGLAMMLDSAAQALRGLGKHADALSKLKQADLLFGPEESEDHAVNALERAKAHLALGDRPAAGSAFRRAHDLAIRDARAGVDQEHYARGFKRVLPTGCPPTAKLVSYGPQLSRLGRRAILGTPSNSWGRLATLPPQVTIWPSPWSSTH